MVGRRITVVLAATTLFAAAAFGQTPSATSDQANTPSNAVPTSSLKGVWRASKVVGLGVYNDTNEKLGSINDLLVDKSGNIKAVVLGVGGILGVGQRLVAVPLDKVRFVNEPVAYTGAASGDAEGTAMNRTTMGSATTTAPQGAASDPWYPDHVVFEATKDELRAMPEFKY